MGVSIIMAHKDEPFLWFTLDALLKNTDTSALEIIIVDDASENPLEINPLIYPNIRVIHNQKHLGVGLCFDIGVSKASYDTIILMGADVIVKEGYLGIVSGYVSNYPNSIGCSVCLSGDPNHLDPLNPANDIKRYGATIIPFSTTDDLRSDNQINNTESYYVGLFDNRWNKQEPEEEISEVACCYGAFYFTTKLWYDTLHGWDNSFRYWGGLEQWLCLKNWLYGGKCHVVKSLETLHIFNKSIKDGIPIYTPSGKIEWMWFNKLFIAYTLLPGSQMSALVRKVYNTRIKYELHTSAFNMGNHLAKKYCLNMNMVRERNYRSFVHNFDWFCEKFNIIKNF